MIKLYSWSHCSNEWVYHCKFNLVSDIESYLKEKGFDPMYFKYNENKTP